MLNKYHYSDDELKALLQSLTVIVDSREQKNEHITNYFDKNKIAHKSRKLDFGDYSFFLPSNPALGIPRDVYFTGDIAVERKSGLVELSGNLTSGRAAFENELIRATGAKLFLMIESGSLANIAEHKYRTQFQPKAFIAALKTFEARYGLDINFVTPELAGNFIYYTFYYFLREYLGRCA